MDDPSADLEVGPEWNMVGDETDAKGGCAGGSALGTWVFSQAQVNTCRESAFEREVVEAADEESRRIGLEREGRRVDGLETVSGERGGPVDGDLSAGRQREVKKADQAEGEPERTQTKHQGPWRTGMSEDSSLVFAVEVPQRWVPGGQLRRLPVLWKAYG